MRIIAGHYRGKKLSSPLSVHTRPTSDRVREMIFNVLLHSPKLGLENFKGKKVLDVFAGTGSLGLEAFSRGASSLRFIENHPEALPVLYKNIKALNLPPEWVLNEDALKIQRSPGCFDLVFLDPPYEANLAVPALKRLLEGGWGKTGSLFVIEVEKNARVSPPPLLSTIFERQEGASKLLFCKHL